MDKHLTGSAGYYLGDQVTVIGTPGPEKLEILIDRNRYDDEWKACTLTVDEADVEIVEYAELTDFCVAGTTPIYSAFGYLISADGTTYSLTEKWRHGTVLAMLHPELAREQGYRQPDKESSEFLYQRFELDNYRQLDAVRIAFGMMTAVAVSKGYRPATAAQIQATAACLKAAGIGMQDEVSLDYGDMTVRKALQKLEEDHTPSQPHELTPPDGSYS